MIKQSTLCQECLPPPKGGCPRPSRRLGGRKRSRLSVAASLASLLHGCCTGESKGEGAKLGQHKSSKQQCSTKQQQAAPPQAQCSFHQLLPPADVSRSIAPNANDGRSGAQVTLYEAEERCGGHTLTVDAAGFPVDLGFQVRAEKDLRRCRGAWPRA